MFKKSILIVFILMLLLTTLIGCNKNSTINTSNKDDITNLNSTPKILRVLQGSDIPTLDPSIATDQSSIEVIGNTYEGLFVLTGGDKLENGVCESYSVSDDGKTYVFNLRDDSFWSNGNRVTAHDFVYSFRRLSDPKTESQYSFLIETASIKNGKEIINNNLPVEELGVYAKDEYNLVIELDNQIPYLLNILALPNFSPLNEKFVEEKGITFGTSTESTLFNGPYLLDKWEAESKYIYKKNENYWNKKNINIDIVEVKIIKDPNTALDMYKSEEIDFVRLVGEQTSENYNDKDLVKTLETSVFYLELDQKNEVLKNVNARKAIALGFDKSYITDEILNNGSIKADYLVPNNFSIGPDKKFFRETTKTYNHYDKEKAIKYWTKAKKELGIDTATLKVFSYDSETSRKTTEYIKEQIETNLEGLTIEIVTQGFS